MIVSVNAEKSFHKVQYIFTIKKKKTPLSKQGIEQEFLNLWVSMGLLESRSQDKIRQARNLLEEMLVRGSEQKA